MLDIAFELIGEATSNSLLMFCFCNFIIVMIITGSPKPSSIDSQDSTFITSGNFNMCKIASNDHDCGDDKEEEINFSAVSYAEEKSLINASSVSEEEEEGRESCNFCDDKNGDDDDNEEYGDDDNEEGGDDDNEEDSDDDNEEDGDDENELENDVDDESKEAELEEDDDDLRKRVEEFIAKINNEWRHDKLRALNLVY